MEVAPGIHRIEAPLGDRFVCMYLLRGDGRCLLIDTGLAPMPGEVIEPYLDSIGLDWDAITYVLTSHIDFDHTGGNAAVRRRAPGAVFMCHELDRAMIEDVEAMMAGRYSCYAADHGIDESDETKAFVRENSGHVPIDVSLRGGESLRLAGDWTVQILHTPGHSLGHVSVWDERSGSLIVLDAALGDAVLSSTGEPALPPTYRYPSSYESTLQRFASMGAARVLTSHYPVYEADAADEFIALSTDYVQRVEERMRAALRKAGRATTLRQIIDETAADLGRWPDATYLCWPMTGHLERMERRGLVEKQRVGGLAAYAWRGGKGDNA